jgi:hypothetical protein
MAYQVQMMVGLGGTAAVTRQTAKLGSVYPANCPREFRGRQTARSLQAQCEAKALVERDKKCISCRGRRREDLVECLLLAQTPG